MQQLNEALTIEIITYLIKSVHLSHATRTNGPENNTKINRKTRNLENYRVGSYRVFRKHQ